MLMARICNYAQLRIFSSQLREQQFSAKATHSTLRQGYTLTNNYNHLYDWHWVGANIKAHYIHYQCPC
jgi:hypothetical protein